MHSRIVALVVAVSAGSALAQVVRADAGVLLLLGVAASDALSTIQITEAGIESLGRGLPVPTPSGWLRISEVGTTADSRLVVTRGELARSTAERAGITRAPRRRPSDDCASSSGVKVLAATPARLLYEGWTMSLCEGQNRASRTSAAVALSLGKTGGGPPLAIEAVLGPAARSALDRATGYDERESYGDFDPAAWGFFHAQGAWRVVVYDRPIAPNGDVSPLTLEVPAPPAIVGIERLPSTWDAIHTAHPEAADAIGAPDGRFLVLITAAAVVALRSDGSELGRLSLTRPTVVMTQWAVGEANSARWAREARAVLSR